jgi:hypothetical protein
LTGHESHLFHLTVTAPGSFIRRCGDTICDCRRGPADTVGASCRRRRKAAAIHKQSAQQERQTGLRLSRLPASRKAAMLTFPEGRTKVGVAIIAAGL